MDKSKTIEPHPLKRYRKAEGLTQEQLGEMLGVTKQMVSMIENRRANPSPHLAGLAERVSGGQITAYELLYGDGLPDFPKERERVR